jgi:polysaccharide biosynthesis protein PslH
MKKKILFVTPGVPLPPTGGGTRSHHLLRAAAAAGSVDLLTFEHINNTDKEQLALFCNSITHQPLKIKPAETSLHKLRYRICLLFPFFFSASTLNHEIGFFVRNRMRSMPLLRTAYFHWLLLAFRTKKTMPSIAYQLLNKNKTWQQQLSNKLNTSYDVLIIDFSYMGFLFQQILPQRFKQIIVNTHNVEHTLMRQSAADAVDAIEAKWIELQANMIEQAEMNCLKIAHSVFCCSANDQLKFQQMHRAAVLHIVPNGVDLTYYKPAGLHQEKQLLLFTGTMNYGPNIDAMKWFIPNVFVPLQKKYPKLQLLIAGQKAGLAGFNSIPGVIVENDPPDMRPFFEESLIVVVPLRQGSGTRLKILEAAAMKKPVVSTSLGAEGLVITDNEILLSANNAAEFCESVEALLNNNKLCNKIADNAYNWVAANYSWHTIRQQVTQLINPKSLIQTNEPGKKTFHTNNPLPNGLS